MPLNRPSQMACPDRSSQMACPDRSSQMACPDRPSRGSPDQSSQRIMPLLILAEDHAATNLRKIMSSAIDDRAPAFDGEHDDDAVAVLTAHHLDHPAVAIDAADTVP